MLKEHLQVKRWGNSKGIRIPNVVARQVNIALEDEFTVEVDKKNRIILTKIVEDNEKELTISELFSGYEEGSFQSDIQDLGEARGNEKW